MKKTLVVLSLVLLAVVLFTLTLVACGSEEATTTPKAPVVTTPVATQPGNATATPTTTATPGTSTVTFAPST